MFRHRMPGLPVRYFCLVIVASVPVLAQQVEVINEDGHGLVGPVRLMTVDQASENLQINRPRPQGPSASTPDFEVDDPVLQEVAGAPISTTPGLSVLGLGTGFSGFRVQYAPPDTNAAVGATQVVETVNISYAVFNKTTGAIVAGPIKINKLFTGVDASCADGTNLSDPVVLYDQLAKRWVVEIITVSSPYKYCYAVSTSSDAAGTYRAYAFTERAGLPDYAKTAIWPDAYYSSARLFAGGSSYAGPKACAADRTAMLAGSAATQQCFQIRDTTIDGMLPSNLEGATPPPSGSPNFFLVLGPTGSNKLELFKFQVDFKTPKNSTLIGPADIAVAPYSEAGSFRSVVPQEGTSTKLDALGFTLMHRLTYRNYKARPAHESLFLTHNINVGRRHSRKRVAPRWYEIRTPNGTPTVFQQGTFSPDLTDRWTASLATDRAGDIALGYSASSSSIHPAIRYTGRVPTDPAGKLEAEATILQGNGSQTGLDRWGDYSNMSVDPADDCTFWYSQEFIPTNGSFNWSTQLASFKFDSCK